ncbi:hypothetical protein ABDK00_013540 [Niabella insulamsoli]|uniref:hypothetical protein n=1 Tax=Niabella insulamsoli TaxID=3144874 RepID=UPI0031FBE424
MKYSIRLYPGKGVLLLVLYIVLGFFATAQNIPQKGVYWNIKNYKSHVYLNGTDIAESYIFLFEDFLGGDAHIYIPKTKSFYNLKGFRLPMKSTEMPKEHPGNKGVLLPSKVGDKGFWFLNSHTLGTSYYYYKLDGTSYGLTDKILLNKDRIDFDTDNNLIVQLDNGEKIVLNKYKKALVKWVYPIVSYDANKHEKANTVENNATAKSDYSKGVWWMKKKRADGKYGYLLFNDGESILANSLTLFTLNGNHIFYYPKTRTFCEMTGYEDSRTPLEKFIRGRKIDYKIGDKGFWYKKSDGFVYLKPNGTSYNTTNKKASYTDINNDLVFTFNNGETIVLENYYNNPKEHTVYPIVSFDANKHKKATTNILPTVTYKKTQDGKSFWLYENGKQVPKGTVWLYSNQGNGIVYYPPNQRFYELTDFYNNTHVLKILPAKILNAQTGNKGFWTFYYKDGKKLHYYLKPDGTHYNSISAKAATNFDANGNLIYTLNTGETIILIDYKTGSAYTVYPIIAKNATTAHTVDREMQTLVNQWLAACSNSNKCLAEKFDAWYLKQKQVISEDQLHQGIAQILTALYNNEKERPFQLLMLCDKSVFDQYKEFKKYLSATVRNQVTRSSQKMIKDHEKSK